MCCSYGYSHVIVTFWPRELPENEPNICHLCHAACHQWSISNSLNCGFHLLSTRLDHIRGFQVAPLELLIRFRVRRKWWPGSLEHTAFWKSIQTCHSYQASLVGHQSRRSLLCRCERWYWRNVWVRMNPVRGFCCGAIHSDRPNTSLVAEWESHGYTRFQAFAAKYMRTEPFCVITPWVVTISYRRFGTNCRSHLHESRGQEHKKFLTLEDRCPEMSVRDYHYSLHNNPKEHSSHGHILPSRT